MDKKCSTNGLKSKIQYRHKKQKQIVQLISNCKKIYLDLNYWIRIRDAHVGKTTDPECKTLYTLILELVNSGKVICPVSPVVLIELLKQCGNSIFFESIRIIELLSKNIITVTEEEIIFFQFKLFFAPFLKQEIVCDDIDFIWTKAIDAFGHGIPKTHFTTKNVQDDIALYKSFLDFSWDMTLSDLFNLSNIGIEKQNFDFKNIEAISRLNKENINHNNEFNTFDSLLHIERRGTLDAFKFIAWRAFEDVLEDCSKDYSEKTKIKIFRRLMEKSINSSSQISASIEIPAGLHSVIRYENWEYKDFNDIFDYHHSYTAVPFFDYFFTERKLSNLLNHRRLNFGKKYNCIIEHKLSKTISLLEKFV